MTTIIMGANGRLGGLLNRHNAHVGLDWKSQAREGSADILWSGQMSDPATQDVFQQGATLINMIGVTSGDVDELSLVNVQLVQNILKRASDTGVAHIIFASSAAVYGNGSDRPLTEDTALAPLTAYGTSKAQMEDVIRTTAANTAMPAITILRIGNVAGSDALLAAAESSVLKGNPMNLHRFDNGAAPLRSYIGPMDFFRIIEALTPAHNASPLTLNVAAPTPVSLDVALNAYKAHLLPKLSWKDSPVPNGVPQQVVLSTRALEDHVTLDWKLNYASEMTKQVAQDRSQ